jgi:hypothetical protein
MKTKDKLEISNHALLMEIKKDKEHINCVKLGEHGHGHYHSAVIE